MSSNCDTFLIGFVDDTVNKIERVIAVFLWKLIVPRGAEGHSGWDSECAFIHIRTIHSRLIVNISQWKYGQIHLV